MTKKDFQGIARVLYEVRGVSHREVAAVVILRLADVLAASNPRFDRARFIEACETGTCRGMRKSR